MTDTPAYPATIAEFTDQMHRARAALDAFLATLTHVQKEQQGSIRRYAIKDHLAHLAIWQQGMIALLDGQSRWANMKLDADYVNLPTTHHDDMNAIIFLYHKGLSYDAAYQMLATTHNALTARLQTMNDADLLVSENRWHERGTEESDELPLGVRLMWNTYEHYDEHLPWMQESVQNPFISINHVAVVVPDIGANLPFWRDALGLSLGDRQDVPQEQVRIAFLEADDSHIELVQPTSPDSGIAGYLANKGAGMHHLCFDVPNIEQAITRLREHGVMLLSAEPKIRDGRRYIFVHPKSTGGVLVELYERL